MHPHGMELDDDHDSDDDFYDYEDEGDDDEEGSDDDPAQDGDDPVADDYDETLYSSDDDEEAADDREFRRVLSIMALSNDLLLDFMRNLPKVAQYDRNVAVMVRQIADRKARKRKSGRNACPLLIQQGTDWPALAWSLKRAKSVKGAQKPTVYEFDFSIWPGAATHHVPFRGRQLRRPDYTTGLSWPAMAQALHDLAVALGQCLAPHGTDAATVARLGNRALATAILYIVQGRGAQVRQALNDCHFPHTAHFESLVVEFLALALGVEVARLPFAVIDILVHLSNIANARGFGRHNKPYTFLNVFSSVRHDAEGRPVHTYITGQYGARDKETTVYQGFRTAPPQEHTSKYDDQSNYKSQKSVGKSTFSHSAGHDRLVKLLAGDKRMAAALWRQVRQVDASEDRRKLHSDRIYYMSPLRAYNLFANLLSTCNTEGLTERQVAAQLIDLLRTFLQGQRCTGDNIFAGFLATSSHCTFGNAVLTLQLAEKVVTPNEKLHSLAVTALQDNKPGDLMFMIDHSAQEMVPVVVKLLMHESKAHRDPLIHFAVHTGRLDIVRFVLEAGGNPFETDRKGKPVLALALELGMAEIAQALVTAQEQQRDSLTTLLPDAWSFLDLTTDHRWLTDNEVTHLLQQANLPYDTYIAPAVDIAGHPATLATFIRDNYWHQMRQRERVCKYTVIPINFRNAHWAALIIVQNPQSPTEPYALFFDPRGTSTAKLQLIERVLKLTGIYLDPMIGDFCRKLQTDSYTCGTWLVTAAEIITNAIQTHATTDDIKNALGAAASGIAAQHTANLKKFGR